MSQPEPTTGADFTVSMPESWRPRPARSEPTQPDSPDARIAVIEDSLQCFTYGWLACVPVFGVAWLYPAVRRFVQARRRKVEWNPARGYLAAGLALASVGWVIGLVVWLIVFNALAVAGEWVSSGNDFLGTLPTVLFVGAMPSFAGLVVAWRVVWEWLARRSARFQIVVWSVALLLYLTLGLTLDSRPVHWQEPDYQRQFRGEMTVLGVWALWLFGGFVLLARKGVALRIWLIWLAVLALLSALVANL